MNRYLQNMGLLFIFFVMLSPFIGYGIYHSGKAAGVRWSTQQVYGLPKS